MIRVENIRFSYNHTNGKSKEIFRGLDFSIAKGEFVSILGRSGCGKTTLASILSGYTQADSGEVRINNTVVTKPGRNRILVNQEHDLFDWMTVSQNIGIVDGTPAAVRRLLSLVHMTEYADCFPMALSGGFKKRLSLARALAAKPDFIILDEPFSSLDSVTKSELQRELDTLFTLTKKTTLLVTHDIDEAILLSDRIFVLKGAPARIQYEVAIPNAHPRRITDRNRKTFARIKKSILANY